ncbi:LuxR C-terminal-related transcriptional regulator [Rhodococcus sp. NPDC056960]|uniref:LuxR C-terminal-related transcriptional regulator n=1 Tax=Rhodococcus sp. NPDC056960 TaxID=3345982 RepID=UPI00363F7008
MASVWPLVGRDEELRLINAAVTAADDYGGVVIAGPAGVGKSRLAREAVTHISPGRWLPRWARATASARALPLGAFAEWAGDLAKDPMLVVRGVIEHLTTVPSGAKAILGVDDAHLLDDLSAFVVLQLAQRRLAKVVVTIRTGEPAPDAVTALWKEGHLQRVELQPLSETETKDLVTAVLGSPLEPSATHRLWDLTRGNTLYLRHLIDQELVSGRLTQHRGRWTWTGTPIVSAGLAELIDTQIGSLPDPICTVLDFLAIGEPIAEGMLAMLTGPDAVEVAHSSGLITVAPRGRHLVRLAHPLYGETRRTRGATPLRLQRLRAQLATILGSVPDADSRDLVRRAVLTLESDLEPDPCLFEKASAAALSLMDAGLAETLAATAISSGAGYNAHLTRALALASRGCGADSEKTFAHIPTRDLTTREITDVACMRALTLLWLLDRPEQAGSVLDTAGNTATEPAALTACYANIHAHEGRPQQAVDDAHTALASPQLTDLGTMAAIWALTIGLGDLGRTNQIGPIATRGYELIARSPHASPLRYALCDFHTFALRLAGYVTEAEHVAVQVCGDTSDAPGWPQIMSSIRMGQAALAAGRLTDAQQWIEALFALRPAVVEISGWVTMWLDAIAQVRAMTGDHDAAAAILHKRESLNHIGFTYQQPQHILTRAWVAAAHGTTTEAIDLARQGATNAAAHDQHAQEVVCLHTATRFGDRTTTERLRELAEHVDGPRAPAAAQHATALADGDPEGLADASRLFEEMGDLLAAADAAAHAATAYRHQGRNGSALAATARAQHLADTCGGAHTPALREAQQPSPLTARQREIITLATQGLTNKQIADHLTMSVRTVEGHLYRASLKTGANGRDDLGATLTGKQRAKGRRQLE